MCNPHGCTPTSCTGVPAGSKLPREVFRTLIRHQIKTRKKRSLSSQVTYNPDWPWKLQTTTKNNSKNQPLNYHRDSYTNLGYWESTAMRYTPEKWSFDTYHGFYIAGPIKGPAQRPIYLEHTDSWCLGTWLAPWSGLSSLNIFQKCEGEDFFF